MKMKEKVDFSCKWRRQMANGAFEFERLTSFLEFACDFTQITVRASVCMLFLGYSLIRTCSGVLAHTFSSVDTLETHDC